MQSQYHFDDFPYFASKGIADWAAVFFMAILLCVIMLLGKLCRWNIFLIMGLFACISVFLILAVPLYPFSDMKCIYDIAVHHMKDEIGYLQIYYNQIPITLYLCMILQVFGESILVPKLFNILFDIIILFFLYKIYRLLSQNVTQSKAIIWFAAGILPVFLYENHIYSDVPFTALTVILIYLILKADYTPMHLSVMIILSVLQYLLRPVGIIYIIAAAMYMIFAQKEWKKCSLMILVIMIGILSIVKLNITVFKVDTNRSYPIWSYIQMGINEEEFGFQDGSHSSDWTFEDCVEKYRQTGVKGVLKIYGKKEAWMWTEGTYQAQRYGLGDAAAVYTEENRITEKLHSMEHSGMRNALERLMKGQYYIYMVLALLGLWQLRKEKRCQLFLYIICGFFCFYLLWEIKSRYIYSLYPLFTIFAFWGWNWVMSTIKNAMGSKFVRDGCR